MAIGTSNQTEISIIEEAVAGTTPAAPALQILRMTGETLQGSNSTTTSEEIRADRATSDIILTDQSNTGDINGEISGGTYDKLFRGLLFSDNDWTNNNLTGVTIAATVDGFADSADGFVAAGFEVGQYVWVEGLANPLLNRAYKVLTVAAGAITTSPAPVALEAEGEVVEVSGSTITNGVTDRSFTVVKRFKDLATVSHLIFRGARIGTASINLSVGSIANLTFSLTAQNSEITETPIAGATYLPQSTTEVMNCVNNVTEIKLSSAILNEPLYFSELSLSYDNQLRELKAIGSLGSIDVRAGSIMASATVNPYFENIEILEVFQNNAAFELSFNLQSSDGYEYILSYPRAKFASQDVSAGGKDQDLIVNSEVTAILDPVSLSMIRIDRKLP